MKMDLLTAEHEEACDAFLSRHQDGLLYYASCYRAFLCDLLGCRDETIVARENGYVIGLLPLMRKSGCLGDVINSLPFYGSHGGILADTTETFNFLLTVYNNIVNESMVASATLVANPLSKYSYEKVQHNYTDSRIGQFTPIRDAAAGAEQFLSNFESSTRRNIRKALNRHIKISIDNHAFDFLAQVHFDNMSRIGGKAKPDRFFKLVPRYFRSGDDFNIYVATMDDLPVAALLIFYYNRVVEYFIPVVVEEYRTYQPMALMVYQAMMDASKRGCVLWNWGGTWLNQDGVYKFKKKWNAHEHHYTYYIQVNNPDILSCKASELLEMYPNFFVVPFQELIP